MLPAVIRKLSCNPVVRSVAGHLRISHLARRVYCRLLSNDGVLQVSLLGVNARFTTRDSQQLAFVDYILTTERDFIEFALDDLHDGESFLDVGSHYGIFSVLASKLVGPKGRVIAVEPHPGALQVLRENIDGNRCANVEVLNVAFSDTTGSLPLFYNANGAGPQAQPGATGAAHVVQAMAGDHALCNVVPAAVKIDVEGHEFAVLNGLKQTLSSELCRRVCLEIHPTLLPPNVNADGIMAFIENCGFRVLHESVRPPAVHIVAIK